MTSRYWVRFFLTTLLLGGTTGIIAGFIGRWEEFHTMFSPIQYGEILSAAIWLFGLGLIYSVISQMGFFSYLTIHRFGLGIFKTVKLWSIAQLILIVFTVGDLVYFDFTTVAIIIATVGLIIATIKAKQTNKETFISALFFMVVVTSIELISVLRVNNESWIYFMLIPLLACNLYQLLFLPYYLKRSQMEREKKDKGKTKV